MILLELRSNDFLDEPRSGAENVFIRVYHGWNYHKKILSGFFWVRRNGEWMANH
jgi:hypothetical protein